MNRVKRKSYHDLPAFFTGFVLLFIPIEAALFATEGYNVYLVKTLNTNI